MMPLPLSCMVDASVAAKLVLVEPDSDKARELFGHLGDPATRIHFPDHFYGECANIFWKYLHRKLMTAVESANCFQSIENLNLQQTVARPFVATALRTAMDYDATVYDSLYVITSAALNVPLVTADKILFNKFAGSSFQIILFDNLIVPPSPAVPAP